MDISSYLDKSNNFNQLDEMQNHMSNLITVQNEKRTDDYVVRRKNKKTKKTPRKQNTFWCQFFKLIRIQKKVPTTRLKETKSN